MESAKSISAKTSAVARWRALWRHVLNFVMIATVAQGAQGYGFVRQGGPKKRVYGDCQWNFTETAVDLLAIRQSLLHLPQLTCDRGLPRG